MTLSKKKSNTFLTSNFSNIMGYCIFSFAADVEKVKQVFDSCDSLLFDQIQDNEVFKNYASQDFENHISTREALRHIINGEPYRKHSAHAYWYALISIFAFLGHQLPYNQDIELDNETELIDNYLRSDFGIETTVAEILLNNFPDLGLPDVATFPLAGAITHSEISQLSNDLQDVVLSNNQIELLWHTQSEKDEIKAFVYNSIKGFKDNIDFCYENNLSLISFCH